MSLRNWAQTHASCNTMYHVIKRHKDNANVDSINIFDTPQGSSLESM